MTIFSFVQYSTKSVPNTVHQLTFSTAWKETKSKLTAFDIFYKIIYEITEIITEHVTMYCDSSRWTNEN